MLEVVQARLVSSRQLETPSLLLNGMREPATLVTQAQFPVETTPAMYVVSPCSWEKSQYAGTANQVLAPCTWSQGVQVCHGEALAVTGLGRD